MPEATIGASVAFAVVPTVTGFGATSVSGTFGRVGLTGSRGDRCAGTVDVLRVEMAEGTEVVEHSRVAPPDLATGCAVEIDGTKALPKGKGAEHAGDVVVVLPELLCSMRVEEEDSFLVEHPGEGPITVF